MNKSVQIQGVKWNTDSRDEPQISPAVPFDHSGEQGPCLLRGATRHMQRVQRHVAPIQ